MLYEDSGKDFLFSFDDNNENLLIVEGALISISDSSGTDVFIVDPSGKVILCREITDIYSDKLSGAATCLLHNSVQVRSDILTGAESSYPKAFHFEGQLSNNHTENYFTAAVPVYYNGRISCYVIAVQTVSDAYIPYTTEFIRMIISTALIAVFLTFITSLIVSYRMVRPLKKLTAITQKYASGNFEERVNSFETYNELQELVDAFNSMAESLAVTEESRSSFVANVSHELKTPMTIINGFVDGILDGTINSEDRDKYLTVVSEESKRLSRLVIAMLNMSKIEAGKLTLTPSGIELSSMLCNTLVGFEKNINDKNIVISGLDDLENITVNADDALINQVIYNLIDNAVKFTPQNGEITFSVYSEKKYAVIRIKNSGRGIPQEDCELVFDRFYKVDKSRGLDSNSFGLGLYIVKSIIELHNGTISINSEENSFTEFILKLPL